MRTTIDYLNSVMKAHNLGSDYQLAKFLGVTQAAISRYRKRKNVMDDYTALRVANALEKNPLEIIATANAERAREDTERKAWRGLLRRIAVYFPGVTLLTREFISAYQLC